MQLTMKKISKGSIASLLLGASLLAAPAISTPKVDVKLVDHGEGKLKEVVATAVVNAPKDKVWKALTDYPNYKNWMPRIATSKLDRHSGTTMIATMTLDLPWPLKDTWYTNKYTQNPGAGLIQWQMLKGSLKVNQGSWQMKAHSAKQTHLTYRIQTDPGVPLLPKWMINTATQQTIPSIFDAIEKRANKL